MAKHYSEKGIAICERWIKSFVNFYEDMGEKPDPNYTIERIDRNGNYELGNCKWASNQEQQRNKSTNIYIEVNGQQIFLKDYAKIIGIPYPTLGERYRKGLRGKDLFVPINQTKVRVKQEIRKFETSKGLLSLREIETEYRIGVATLRSRLVKGLVGEKLYHKGNLNKKL